MATESGVDLLLHAMVTGVEMDGRRIRGLQVATKAGIRDVRADQFVDCSGDADVVAQAGGEFVVGRPGDHLSQPASRIFWLGNVDLDAFWDYLESDPDEVGAGATRERVRQMRTIPGATVLGLRAAIASAKAAGDLDIPRNTSIMMTYPGRPIVGVNMSRVQGVDGSDPMDVTRGEVISQLQIADITEFYRHYVPGFQDCYIATAPHELGIRESRHIVGKHVLTGNDVLSGRDFPDQIGRCAYPFDIHGVTPGELSLNLIPLEVSFAIPLRSLIPNGVDNLSVGGRCISADHEGSSAVRGQAGCMVTGQAAGVLAALASAASGRPAEIPADRVQEALLDQKAVLERNEVCEDLLVPTV